jgi:RNA polymerase sigma factor (sigma-70 family)
MMMDANEISVLNTELNVVYRYLLKIGVPKTDAEDIVQETAYKYLLYYDSIRSTKIRSWLIRVALNFHYDQCRKLSRIELVLDDIPLTSRSSEQPEMVIETKENSKQIENALSKLKTHYQELLLLKYHTGLSYLEISNVLDMSISSIKTDLFRARKQLAKVLKEANYEE